MREEKRLQLSSSIEQIQIKEIAMFNLHVSVEQSSREQQEFEVIHNETSLNTDLHSDRYLEGYWGCEPSHPEEQSYWSGHQIGSREY